MFDSPFANTKRLRHKGHIYRLKKKPKPHKAWARSINLSLKKFAALPKTELLTGWNISPARGKPGFKQTGNAPLHALGAGQSGLHQSRT
jgi:hypothetical protein